MEKKEFEFKGLKINGFLMLFVIIALFVLTVWGFVEFVDKGATVLAICSVVLFILDIVFCIGFRKLEPNEATVMVFFGKYCGTMTSVGFFWVNPFYSSKKVSLRARNLNVDPIKVNDKTGNPIMIGQILVWKLKDT